MFYEDVTRVLEAIPVIPVAIATDKASLSGQVKGEEHPGSPD